MKRWIDTQKKKIIGKLISIVKICDDTQRKFSEFKYSVG